MASPATTRGRTCRPRRFARCGRGCIDGAQRTRDRTALALVGCESGSHDDRAACLDADRDDELGADPRRAGAHAAGVSARSTRASWKEWLVTDVAYTSHVTIERVKGPLRKAHLPGEERPVVFSVHGAIAEHYKVDPSALG